MRQPFCRAFSLASFGVLGLLYASKTHVLKAIECLPFFDPKPCGMTSLKQNFPKITRLVLQTQRPGTYLEQKRMDCSGIIMQRLLEHVPTGKCNERHADSPIHVGIQALGRYFYSTEVCCMQDPCLKGQNKEKKTEHAL